MRGWNPFAAHKKCSDLGLVVNLNDAELWRGSVGVDRAIYAAQLERNAQLWGWDSEKIKRELEREYGA